MPTEHTLRELMERQAHFDSKHGDGASWDEKASGDNPSLLEHGVVCLVGEIGEFANVLKKVVRGDLSYEAAQPLLREEITDAFIYLIKLCNQMNVDLSSEFLAKLERNWERFKPYERQ